MEYPINTCEMEVNSLNCLLSRRQTIWIEDRKVLNRGQKEQPRLLASAKLSSNSPCSLFLYVSEHAPWNSSPYILPPPPDLDNAYTLNNMSCSWQLFGKPSQFGVPSPYSYSTMFTPKNKSQWMSILPTGLWATWERHPVFNHFYFPTIYSMVPGRELPRSS